MQTFFAVFLISMAMGFALAALIWPVLWSLGVFECPARVRAWFGATLGPIVLTEPPLLSSNGRIQVGGRYELSPHALEFVRIKTGATSVFERPLPAKRSRGAIYAPST
jgi:hypothetical protein